VIVDNPALVLFLLKATVLLLAGAAVAQALRRANAGARHLVWLATLSGLLLLPAAPRLAPLRLEVLPHSYVTVEDAGARAPLPWTPRLEAPAAGRGSVADTAPGPSAANAAADARPTGALAVTVREILFAGWGAGALVLLAYFGAGGMAVRRIIRGATPMADLQWTSLLAEASDRLDLARLPRLVASERVELPFAYGAWRPTIVLPAKAAAWSDERRRLVLAHELAHVKRHDLLGHTLGRLACALYWFHPLVWVAARRLRAESERASDDLVLGSGARASDYADHLLDILASVRRERVPAAALAMARRREFEGRLLAILDPALERGGPRRTQSVALLVGLAALFVTVAASAPSEPPNPGATSAPGVGAPASPASPRGASFPAAAASSTAVSSAAAAVREDDPGADEPETEAEVADLDGQDDDAMEATHALTPERRDTLVRVLRNDSDASVRRTAAWALSGSGEAEAADALAAALRGDASEEVRETAAWALGGVRSAVGAAALNDALRGDASAEVRGTAAWALGHRRQADVSALLAAVSDKSAHVREAAIWALGNQKVAKAPEPLLGALRDADDRVRVVAAWALAQMQDPASGPALRAAFKDEKDDEVRRAFFHAAFLLSRDGATDVGEWAVESKDPGLRQLAIQALANRRRPWPWPWPRPEPRPLP
jgi:beta-lactamase regulating signal transducer with metallopeptidase domain/HEAT repeat protein